MGYTSYDSNTRSVRAQTLGYATKSMNELFEQNLQQKVHESLIPKNLKVRECFDSAQHPNTIATIFGLDVTGSMGRIPHMLIQEGLPTMMDKIIEAGSPDVAVCFVAIGDHLNDRAPFQVAQFESGDEELDNHLKNTWLEGNGGGNGGESYALAWYFAAYHTNTHCYDKRNQKGILITVGDENVHRDYSAHDLRAIFGETAAVERTITADELLKAAQEKYHVYHLGLPSYQSMEYFKKLLGNNFIPMSDYHEVPNKVAEIVLKHSKEYGITRTYTSSEESVKPSEEVSTDSDDIIFVK